MKKQPLISMIQFETNDEFVQWQLDNDFAISQIQCIPCTIHGSFEDQSDVKVQMKFITNVIYFMEDR